MNKIQQRFRRSILRNPDFYNDNEYFWALSLKTSKPLTQEQNNELNRLQKKKDGNKSYSQVS